MNELIKRATSLYLQGLITKDELAELAKVFNEIAEKLEESRDQTEKTERSVDIRVRARTKALEETINALEQKVKNRTIELDRLVKESGKLQQDVMGRETETEQLKKELGDLKQKLGRYNKSKSDEESNIEEAQQS